MRCRSHDGLRRGARNSLTYAASVTVSHVSLLWWGNLYLHPHNHGNSPLPPNPSFLFSFITAPGKVIIICSLADCSGWVQFVWTEIKLIYITTNPSINRKVSLRSCYKKIIFLRKIFFICHFIKLCIFIKFFTIFFVDLFLAGFYPQ